MDGQIGRGHDTYPNAARTRIACVWLPRFGLRLASKLDPLCQTGTDNEQSTDVSRGDGTGGRTEDGDVMGRVALFRPGTRWQELLECSDDLEAEGVVPGTPLKEAQSRHPDARYLPCDPPTLEAIRAAFGAVVTALAPYSPVIEPALGVVPGVAGTTRDAVPAGVHVDPARAVIFLDVAGLEARYGPEDDLAHHLADTASQASGGDASVGIGPGKFTAWVAAATAFATASRTSPPSGATPARRLRWREISGVDELGGASHGRQPGSTDSSRLTGAEQPAGSVHPTGTTWLRSAMVVAPGTESVFLAPLPLTTLPLAFGVRRALGRLGIQTLGQFATLSPNAVMTRYGAATRHAHALVTGQDNEPLRPVAPPLAAQVTTTFEWEETDLDRLTFTLRTLAGQLIARLRTLAYPEGEMRDDLADSGGESDPAFDPCAPDPLPDEEFANADSGDDETAPLPPPQGRRWAVASTNRRRQALPEVPAPFAVEALRVTWHLAPRRGQEIADDVEALLRLAEPVATERTLADHLRWHVEGLDRLLADPATPTHTLDSCASSGAPTSGMEAVTYESTGVRRGVVGITVEAAGIGTPPTNQLTLHLTAGAQPGWIRTRRDPVQQARAARQVVARLQARWGDDAVGELTTMPEAARLPEHADRWAQPKIGVQVGIAPITARSASARSGTKQLETRGGWGDEAKRLETRGRRGDGSSTALTDHGGTSLPGMGAPYWLVDPPRPVGVYRENPMPTSFAPGRIQGRQSGTTRLETGLFPSVPGAPASPRVIRTGGPWPVVDPTVLVESDPPRRDYFQVETDDRRVYLVYRVLPDHSHPPEKQASATTWFLQGIYD